MGKLIFTTEAASQLKSLKTNGATKAIYKQVAKALAYLEANPRHKSLNTHEISSFQGEGGEKVFEAYAQNNTPGAYRIFWHYGPDKVGEDKKRISQITILAILQHL